MSFGFTEIALILLIIIVLFGAKKIPDLMSGIGKGIKAFKKETKDENKDEDKVDKS